MEGGPIALGLYLVYLALAFGARTWIQIRRTGSSRFKDCLAAVTVDRGLAP